MEITRIPARSTGGPPRHSPGPPRPWHAAAMTDRLTRLVVDSPSLFYRAFFALPASIKGPDGNSVNAIRGYLDMVSRVLVDRRPEAVANVFDADWRPQWRVDLYAGYKAKRAEDPPELPGQVPVLVEVLDAAGLPVAAAAGYAADGGRPAASSTIAAVPGPVHRGQRRGPLERVQHVHHRVADEAGVPPDRY